MKVNDISGHFVSFDFISFSPMNIYTRVCMGDVCLRPLNLGGVVDAVRIHKKEGTMELDHSERLTPSL